MGQSSGLTRQQILEFNYRSPLSDQQTFSPASKPPPAGRGVTVGGDGVGVGLGVGGAKEDVDVERELAMLGSAGKYVVGSSDGRPVSSARQTQQAETKVSYFATFITRTCIFFF